MGASERDPPQREGGFEHLFNGLLRVEAEHFVRTLRIADESLEYEFVLRCLAQETIRMLTRRSQRCVPRDEPPS
jgi:hypothetical protein